jgi:ABC-2 type transport system ATP-binding protein
MLNSILRPTFGHAKVAGFDVVKDAAAVRAIVGVLTEHHGFYGRMNAEEYLLFFGELFGVSKNDCLGRINPLLVNFGLDEHRKKRLGEYSKGMRQKLALIRALINHPPVLLLDEPTSAMDPESARTVRNAILELRSDDRTIVLCTHNLSEAEELADKIAIIREGKIILSDYMEAVKKSLLGNPIFEANFNEDLNGWVPDLPEGISIIKTEKRKFIFEVANPSQSNTTLIRNLCFKHALLSFQEHPRKLEDAYMEALELEVNGGNFV